MTRRRTRACLLPILAFTSVALTFICLGFVSLSWITRDVGQRFGPPSPHLGSLERLQLTFRLWLSADDLMQPANPAGPMLSVDIPLGETPPSIARRLEAAGVIGDAGAFVAYLHYTGLDRTIQAGSYLLSPSQAPIAIAQALQDATPKEVTFTILPGWRLEEIAASLPTSGLEITPQEFLQAARIAPPEFPFLREIPPGAPLEGFFFPGSYRLLREISASDLVAFLLDTFQTNLTDGIRRGFERQGLTVYQGVILASIVERETVISAEMPQIASVFLNRLASGMPLEADSTVQYALGYDQENQTWWKNPLSTRDLQTDSPYNTYRHPGMPPTPIANPGLEALQAVAFPAQTPYYYFRAACDGSGRHNFATTFSEHLSNACPEP